MTLSTDNIGVEHVSDARLQRARAALDYTSVPLLFVFCDIVVILSLSMLAAMASASQNASGAELFPSLDLAPALGVGILASVAFVLGTIARGLYKPWRLVRIVEQARAAALSWVLAILFVGTVIFCLKVGDNTSRLSTGIFAALGLIALPAWRWAAAVWLRRAISAGAVRCRPAVLVGDVAELDRVVPSQVLVRLGLREVRRYVLDAPLSSVSSSSASPNPAVALSAGDLDTLKSALQFARQHRVEEIVVALPWSDLPRLDAVRGRLRSLPIPVKLLPDEAVSELLDAPRVDFGSSIAIEVQRAPLSRFELSQKRALDIAVASVAVTLLLPLFAIIALFIKLDSRGPVIFRQRRNGFGGREFTIFKFRSMTVMEDGTKVVQAQRHDKRVTRIGRFLRATSLDELPQVLNVLFGDMSVVGPRPHAIAHDDAYSQLIAGYAFRHHVKPGITGWAQVQGLRGETAEIGLMERRVEMDLWYITNWSIWLDIKIILRTFIEVFRNEAY